MFEFIEKTCPICKATTVVHVNADAYNTWLNGACKIQDIMPELSPTDRETLITGLCNSCQNDVFEEPEV